MGQGLTSQTVLCLRKWTPPSQMNRMTRSQPSRERKTISITPWICTARSILKKLYFASGETYRDEDSLRLIWEVVAPHSWSFGKRKQQQTNADQEMYDVVDRMVEGVVGKLGPAIGGMVVELCIILTLPHIQCSFLGLKYQTWDYKIVPLCFGKVRQRYGRVSFLRFHAIGLKLDHLLTILTLWLIFLTSYLLLFLSVLQTTESNAAEKIELLLWAPDMNIGAWQLCWFWKGQDCYIAS